MGIVLLKEDIYAVYRQCKIELSPDKKNNGSGLQPLCVILIFKLMLINGVYSKHENRTSYIACPIRSNS